MDEFGNIVVVADVEEAALLTLSTWFPIYLRKIEERRGLAPNSIKNPVKYTNRNEFDYVKGEALPKVVAISPGLLGEPEKHGRQYSATWRLGIGVAFAAKDESEANLLVKIYGAVVRTIMLQKRGLGVDPDEISITDVVWLDETYDDLSIDHQSLLFKAAGEYFGVTVDDVVTVSPGPASSTVPGVDYGQATQVIIDIVKEPIEDD